MGPFTLFFLSSVEFLYISQSVLYLLACMMLNGMMNAVLSSLITPVLSDSFGFTVQYTSYFFIGVSCALLASSFIQ